MGAIFGQTTQYGYPGDPDSDSLTRAGKSAIGSLTSGSMAVSPDVEASLKNQGVSIGSPVRVIFDDGSSADRVWDDRTAKTYKGVPLTGRVDIYSPNGADPTLDGKKVVDIQAGDRAQAAPASASSGTTIQSDDPGTAARANTTALLSWIPSPAPKAAPSPAPVEPDAKGAVPPAKTTDPSFGKSITSAADALIAGLNKTYSTGAKALADADKPNTSAAPPVPSVPGFPGIFGQPSVLFPSS